MTTPYLDTLPHDLNLIIIHFISCTLYNDVTKSLIQKNDVKSMYMFSITNKYNNKLCRKAFSWRNQSRSKSSRNVPNTSRNNENDGNDENHESDENDENSGHRRGHVKFCVYIFIFQNLLIMKNDEMIKILKIIKK